MESAKLNRKLEVIKLRKRKFASIVYYKSPTLKTKPRRRFSFDSHNFFEIIKSPISPNSSLFLRPNGSPGYFQLNNQLHELFTELSLKSEEDFLNDSVKVIQVRNTACSSLMQRRNKSQKTLRKLSLLNL